MSADKRMLFVRNMECFDGREVETHTTEYEVVCDSHIVGELHFDPYYLTIWEFGYKKPGQERLLCLRVKEAALPDDKEIWKRAAKDGFYHGGGIPSELVTLSAVFLRRRLRLGKLVRMDDSPRMFASGQGGAPHYLEGGNANLASLGEWFSMTAKLGSELHQRYMLAARLYQQALELIGTKADLAYLNLVSAVEVLAEDHSIVTPALKEIDGAASELVDMIAESSLREKLRERFLARERFISRRFVAFIMEYIDDAFWQDSTRPERGRILPEALPVLLKGIYEQRSRTLHAGEPFPPGITSTTEELPEGLAMSIGEKKWERSEFIPCVPFFERIVNHVLRNFVKRNQN